MPFKYFIFVRNVDKKVATYVGSVDFVDLAINFVYFALHICICKENKSTTFSLQKPTSA